MGKLGYDRTRDMFRGEVERKRREAPKVWRLRLCEQNDCNNPAQTAPPETLTPEKTGMDIAMLQG